MKTIGTKQAISVLTIAAIVIFGSISFLYASNNRKGHEFRIYIEKTIDSKIILTCLEGCEWDKLEYHAAFNEPEFINQDGFVGKDKKDESDFLLSITPNRNGLIIKGLTGTSWDELEVTCIVMEQCLAVIGHTGAG